MTTMLKDQKVRESFEKCMVLSFLLRTTNLHGGFFSFLWHDEFLKWLPKNIKPCSSRILSCMDTWIIF